MDRVDEILFLYEDDRVEMQDGGPITANKIPLKPVNRNINKKGQPKRPPKFLLDIISPFFISD